MMSTLSSPSAGLSYMPFAYQLHDSDIYPNNRNGIRFAGEYRSSCGNGRINIRLDFLEQNTSSTPQRDITGTFNGYKLGFIDPMFYSLRSNGVAGAGARVYETPRGRQNHYGGGIEYKFAPTPFKVLAQYDHRHHFLRNTGFTNITEIAKQNKVDLKYDIFKIALSYTYSEKFVLKGGYNYVQVKVYHVNANDFNVRAGADVIYYQQGDPFLGFDIISILPHRGP